MAYLGLAMILIVAYAIQAIDNRVAKKSNESCEQIHKEMYDWIDEHYTGHTAREYKARVDATINATFKDNGREYKPLSLEQVLKGDELKERVEAEYTGNATDDELVKAYAIDNIQELIDNRNLTDEEEWFYGEHTDTERFDNLVESIIRKTGVDRAEAERRANAVMSLPSRKE